jgi:SAM-dependent methyltransferase
MKEREHKNTRQASTSIYTGSDESFQDIYLGLRNAEKRLYSDAEVLQLPKIAAGHLHYNEWRIRRASCGRLISYLKKKKKWLRILEIGCGNGWLCHQLAENLKAEVTGMDMNLLELNQAARLFSHLPDLNFIYGDASVASFGDQKFDVIIFAASIQYFSSLPDIFQKCLGLLPAKGEIHIMDSRFYHASELKPARERSANYFRKIGFEQMDGLYHHHSFAELEGFPYKILFDPASLLNGWTGRKTPFHWLLIKPTA